VPVSNIMSEAKLGGTTEFPETSVRERVFENHTQNVPRAFDPFKYTKQNVIFINRESYRDRYLRQVG